MLADFVRSFHPRALPPMLRASYMRELRAWWVLPIMLAMVEGGVISVVVKNAYAGVAGITAGELNIVVAILSAAPAFANITSFLWATIAHGRSKVRILLLCQTLAAALVILIALAPEDRLGLYLIGACACGARVCWAGVVTIRTTLWRANYPRANRASVAGKLAMVQSTMLSLVGLSVGAAMDFNEQIFHLLYPVGGLAGFAGVAIYSRVRLRGQRRLARAELHGEGRAKPSLNPITLWRVLLHDRDFRVYQVCMFVFGIGNLMVSAVLPIVVKDHFGFEYFAGILVTSTIPTIVMPLSIPLWARRFQAGHVVEFRSRHSWVFVSATATIFLAALLQQPWLLFVAAGLMGTAYGGGMLAWNLGHHDFAQDHNSSQYMGVHVTLTGLRGLIGPLVCAALYQWLEQPQTPGRGIWVFGLCLALNLAGALGFVRMAAIRRRSAGGRDA